MEISGASAIVTGGASGIGAAVVRQLAAKGAKVVVADLNAEKGEALAAEVGGVFVAFSFGFCCGSMATPPPIAAPANR